MKFEVSILGNGAATPALSRNPSAQLVNVQERYLLIDCGEGTQLQLRKYKLKFQRINHIFISHLHGDHFFGLIGLMSTYHLLGRNVSLYIYSPPGLKEVITTQLKASDTYLKYKFEFIEIKSEGVLFEDELIKVSCFPLKHRIACFGFKVEEKQKPYNIDKDKCANLELKITDFQALKRGEDIIYNGETIPYTELTIPPKEPGSYAYCSDTIYDPSLCAELNGCNTIYHESTFLSDKEQRAKETFHSTARQAAEVAKGAEVGKLLLGHFSIRYKTTEEFENEAREVFKNTIATQEGQTYNIYE